MRARGVLHAAIFGSRSRAEEQVTSDTDIMVTFDPEAHVTVFDYVELKDYVANLFDGPVDVVNRDALKRHVRTKAVANAIYAF